MGNKKNKQLLIFIILLSVACFFVYRGVDREEVNKSVGLSKYLSQVKGYSFLATDRLDDNIVSVLELDDYANNRYSINGQSVALYIGYYFSLDKVSAAHDPLVCFPGQGWKVDVPTEDVLQLETGVVKYREFVARQGGQQVLIMYWFQAGRQTSPSVYKNKINSAVNLVTTQMQEHAFVRVSVPLVNVDQEEAKVIGLEFIKGFYPVFLDYIKDNR